VPGIPPVAAVGGPADYDVGGWNGLMVPAGTPRPIIDRIYTEIRDGMAVPEVRQRYESVGFDIDPLGPEAMLQHMRKLWGEFGPLIRQLGIRAE
jgi:tripartite-type tricarboxylate transporter receptor subunit TctC